VNNTLEHLKLWRVPLALALSLIVLQASRLKPALEYSREAVYHGQIWRLLTGNLVHLGWTHLTRDLAGLGLIWALVFRDLTERDAVWVLSVSALFVGIGLLLFDPAVTWYVGISGALFGLYTAGALRILRQRRLFGIVLLLGMLAIIAWSLFAGGLPGEATGLGGAVIPQAHLYGAIGGALTLVGLELFPRLNARPGAGSDRARPE